MMTKSLSGQVQSDIKKMKILSNSSWITILKVHNSNYHTQVILHQKKCMNAKGLKEAKNIQKYTD